MRLQSALEVRILDEPGSRDLPNRLGVVVKFYPVHIGIGSVGNDETEGRKPVRGAQKPEMYL